MQKIGKLFFVLHRQSLHLHLPRKTVNETVSKETARVYCRLFWNSELVILVLRADCSPSWFCFTYVFLALNANGQTRMQVSSLSLSTCARECAWRAINSAFRIHGGFQLPWMHPLLSQKMPFPTILVWLLCGNFRNIRIRCCLLCFVLGHAKVSWKASCSCLPTKET